MFVTVNYCVTSWKLPHIWVLIHNNMVCVSQFTCISFLPHDLLLDALHVDIWVMATLRFTLKAFLLSSLTPLSSALCLLSQLMWLVRRYNHLFFYSWTKSTYLWQALRHTHQHTHTNTHSVRQWAMRSLYWGIFITLEVNYWLCGRLTVLGLMAFCWYPHFFPHFNSCVP